MADLYTQERRSEIMSKISGKETKPEIKVRKFLFSQGYRYRKNVSTLPGRPDIVLPKYKTVIFVNGCFWHGHKCKAGKLPSTRVDFWAAKIASNKLRDLKNCAALEASGWKVIVVWQCDMRSKELFALEMERLISLLTT